MPSHVAGPHQGYKDKTNEHMSSQKDPNEQILAQQEEICNLQQEIAALRSYKEPSQILLEQQISRMRASIRELHQEIAAQRCKKKMYKVSLQATTALLSEKSSMCNEMCKKKYKYKNGMRRQLARKQIAKQIEPTPIATSPYRAYSE